MSMIKCPECGERVSTMAGTCPHCGINISGNLRQCPNCNEYCLNTQSQCPYCGTELPALTEEPAEPQAEQTAPKTAEAQQKPATKSRKPLIIAMSVATVIMVIICGIYYLDYKNNKDREEREYAMLENTSNPEYYNDFLAKYPKSIHFQEVKERLKVLLNEGEEWDKMMQNLSRAEIEKFMNAHPYSMRLHDCQDLIDSLDWSDAKKLNTEEAIINYLNTHPNGKYAEEAAQKKNDLSMMKITDQDKAIIRGALENFFTAAMSKQDVAMIAESIPEKMENFCGTQDATPDQIVAFAKNKMASDVMGLHYTIEGDFDVRKQTLSDNTTGYAVTFSLQEIISRSDTNQPSTKTYQVSALLNAEHKITRMSIR